MLMRLVEIITGALPEDNLNVVVVPAAEATSGLNLQAKFSRAPSCTKKVQSSSSRHTASCLLPQDPWGANKFTSRQRHSLQHWMQQTSSAERDTFGTSPPSLLLAERLKIVYGESRSEKFSKANPSETVHKIVQVRSTSIAAVALKAASDIWIDRFMRRGRSSHFDVSKAF
jgi:hypothetical protein